ncbi:likely protein kinase [Pseudozyma hubeiensis SY62]|uniref:non-specific serine/threonine protein kinase n=1 Tax=Pseudozyma hubeiensis (strain SY62) TaxID=1305764 RepID=R9P8K5_PSEHS|nr:likely protein kinase [Pseudozyma hubeiensis SY62]GAC97679.1 likely protein kinase [Pseudozyma hubeiensis SY62]
MSQYGQAFQAQSYPHAAQRNSTPQSGYAQMQQHQQQQQQAMPPMAGAYQQPYKGTLAPGTRVKVGNITVTVKRYLSEGGFAHVYLVTTSQPIPMPSSVTGAVSASMAGSATAERGETVHVLKRMAVPDKAALADVRREVEVHKLLRNQANIVHFIEASATSLQGGGYEIFILMEYCSGGGIISLMNARLRDRLREEEVLKIFGDVCAGVAVMHHLDPPLMHRDLKVENILMAPSTDPGTIPGSRSTSSNLKATFKLCDFGSAAPVLSRKPAKSMDEVKRVEADLNKHTTLQYRAPEMVDVYQRRVIDEKADIWALGVLLYKLCYYTTPFEENGGGPLAILNVQYRIPPQPVYSDRIKQLINSMLKEQSTDRPTVDQVIINVHQILGTRPPQTALHYASAAASGKIAAPLPTLVSGAAKTSSSDVPSLPSRSRPTGGIDANLISMGPTKKELEQAEAKQLELQAQSITPMRRGRPTKAPAEGNDPPAKKLDDDLTKSSSPAPSTSAATAKNAPSWTVPESKRPSVKTGPLIEGFGDSFAPAAPASATSESSPALPKRPSPSFGSPEASGDSASTSDRPLDRNLLRASSSNAPSPVLTPLRHSPALPGFSAVPSPTASPLAPSAKDQPRPPSAQKSGTPRDELADRFPSLEDLDAKYAIPVTSTPPAPSPLSSNATASASSSLPSGGPTADKGHVNVPGLSNRASVGAMAGRFERPFEPQKLGSGRTPLHKSATVSGFSTSDNRPSARSGSVSNRWQTSVIAHDRADKGQQQPSLDTASLKKAAPSKDWLTGDASDQEDDKPAEDAAKEKEAKIYATQPQAPSSDPSATRSDAAGREIEADEESSDEDEPAQPEEAVAQRPTLPPRLSADRMSTFLSRPAASQSQPVEDGVNGKAAKPERPRIVPGRVKAPSWLVDAVDSPTAAEQLISSSSALSPGGMGSDPLKVTAADSLVSPVTDATAAEQLDEAARQAQDQLEALLRGPEEDSMSTQKHEEQEEESPTMPSTAKVKAPAWDDEDEEGDREMNALPKPELQAGVVNGGGKVSPPSVATAGKLSEEQTLPKPSSTSSNIASRWSAASQAQSQASQRKDVQLVDVASSPTPASVSVDSVKDRFNHLSLNRKPDDSSSDATPPPHIAVKASTVSQRSNAEPMVIQPKRPTPIRPQKKDHLRSTSISTLKPWEREAAQSADAASGGIVKNSALPAASTARLQSNDTPDAEVDAERFKGVSSLISRWQASVESNAPGWGKIGSEEDDRAGLGKGLGPKVANQAAGWVRDRSEANGPK